MSEKESDRGKTVAKYESGDYVKAEFKDDETGESEWMWVRVESCDDSSRLVFGWLDSEPVVNARDLHLGQRLAVSYNNIKQHKKPSELPRHH